MRDPALEPAPKKSGHSGDSPFLPVVIAAGVVLAIILILALLFFKSKGRNAVPKAADHKATSYLRPPLTAPSPTASF